MSTGSIVCLFGVIVFSIFCKNIAVSAGTSSALRAEADRFALMEFKKEVTLDPLQILSSWNVSLHFCQWHGVACGRKHRLVTALSLPSLGLAGSLTTHLGNLTFLRSIDLGNNSFRGEIPPEIGRLLRLRHLILRNNSLVGGIPTNLSHCLQLVTMDLRFNKLDGSIPTELGFLPRLDYLNLQFNVLSGIIPASLGNLSTLTGLVLEGCNFEGVIPHQLGQLSRLEILFLGQNRLHGEVPPLLYNLSNIQRFIIHLNNLTGTLPPDIGSTFSNLEIFSVGGNQMTGTVPRSLFNASRLAILFLAGNNFVGSIPVEIGNLRNLILFNIEENNLGGEGRGYDLQFLISLTNCSALSELGAGHNNLHGMLPDSIANLSARLTKVALGSNRIYGSIHSGLGNLVNLQTLGLERNLLTGQIPSSIGKLSMLQALALDENNLTGQLPSSFGNLTQLVVLDLSTNLLHGPLQSGFLLNSANLNYISLANNSLSGTIPPGLATSRNLQHLDLAGNSFTGSIPGDLFVLIPSLRELYLSQNLLSGPLSQEIGKLINIAEVAIDGNELSGTIPESIGNCISLELLYLDDNAFEGAIPTSLAALKVIQRVGLSHNRLEGQIPRDLTKLVYLEYLDLSYNDLRGEVPHEGVFKNVSAFSLQGNTRLCGGILELHLPSCSIKDKTKHGVHEKSARVKLVVALAVSGGVVFSVALCAIAVFCRRRSMRKKLALPISSSNGMQLRLVSYRDLQIATNGFSSQTLIGTGSFGSVYKGYLDQMAVAVKVLNLDLDGASKSFMAECEALRNLRHRNLVKILTCCSGYDLKGMEFKALVFEFMGNGTLESWLHPQGGVSSDHPRILSLEKRLDIAIDVANALDYLHNHSQSLIIHCDLKTSNILLDEDTVAHVSDFGLAKILLSGNGASWQQSSTSKLKGTIGYIPPEYGIGGEVTTRGDVFSYGIILLEMVTGKRPTDSMFTEGVTISTYAKMAFQKQAIEIVDPQLLQQIGSGGIEIVRDCLLSIVQIAIKCSSELPNDRMDMGLVKTELELVKGKLATTRSRFHVQQN